MTIDEIRKASGEILTPADVAPLLHCSEQWLRTAARQQPALLGFPVCVMGTRVRIPRRAFLRWLEGV